MLFAFIVLAVVFAWDYFINQKIVTLNPSQGTTIAIGTKEGDEPIIANQIANTSTMQKIRLHTGTYVVKFYGSKDYQEEISSVRIDKTIEIKTPILKYTNEKLAQLLDTEKASIQKAVEPLIPTTGYRIDIERLFYTGQWYGANLIPNDWYDPTVSADLIPRPTNINNTQDMLKVIMRKVNGKWEIAAGSQIVMAIADYPDIPPDIIRATNKLGLN